MKNISIVLNKIRYLVKDGFAHIFAGTILNKAIAILSSVVIARIIAKDEYAYLNYADTIYGYLILFSGLGMATSILKVCAGKKIGEYDRAYFKFAFKYGLIFEIIITCIVYFVCMNIMLPFPGATEYIQLGLLYPSIMFIADLLFAFIRAKQKNKMYAKINLLQAILSCILSILFVSFIGARGMFIARYLTLGIAVILLLQGIRPELKQGEVNNLDRDKVKAFVWMSLSLVIANAFSGMMPYNENLLVSNIIANEEISANFKVAGLFPQLLLIVTNAINVYFFPIISEMDNRGEDVRRKVFLIGVFNFVLVVGCVMIGIVMSPWLIPFFYGEKYNDAVKISYVLWGMRGINAGVRMIPMNMIIAIGKYKFNLIMTIGSCVFQVICDWYCITKFGIMGVAYGTVIVYVITGILYWLYFVKSANKRTYSIIE